MQYRSYTPFLDGDVDITMHFISFLNFIFCLKEFSSNEEYFILAKKLFLTFPSSQKYLSTNY